MTTAIASNNEDDEFLHPLWLGILILFFVIAAVGMSCLIRKKFGSSIQQFFNQLCCKSQSNHETQSDVNKQPTIPNLYSRTVPYIPRNNVSPKLSKLLRNIKMVNFEKQTSPQSMMNDDNELSVTDKISIDEEHSLTQSVLSENVRPTNSEENKNRTSETARRFYASMRDTSLCKTSSVDSHDNPPVASKATYLIKSKKIEQFRIFRAPQFFQSITGGHE